MKTSLSQKFNVFIVSVVIFGLTAIYCGYVYFSSNSPLQAVKGKDVVDIEVSLPVLEWSKYMDLSKKLNISANIKVKRTVVENPVVSGELKPFK